MLTYLYNRTIALAAHPRALWALAAVSFAESSVFPIPPDLLIIPMVLAAPTRAWRIALVATVASVLGGLAGYAIGAGLFDLIGRPVLEFYGYAERFDAFRDRYNEWGVWIVAGAGFTPFPYKVVTIASGVVHMDPVVFTVASVVSRAGRFFLVAALLWWFGPPIRGFIERHLPLLTALFFVLLFGGFVVVRYVL